MTVRGNGVRDIGAVLEISIKKVLKTLVSARYELTLKMKHDDCLEIDEFWTYAGKKENRVWLIYAYHWGSGEIVSFVWEKRDLKTAEKLRRRLKGLGISYDTVGIDNRDSFQAAFREDKREGYTAGIEGNSCPLRHRIRRVFRKTCCFSKKLLNHWKAFNMAFFYINYGFV
jgi:IS1 family transposase